MDIYLGEAGVNYSWQVPFPKTIECHKCKAIARIMFVAFESASEEKCICKLHKNEGKGKYWLHDACAVAVYLCKNCFEVNALINQA